MSNIQLFTDALEFIEKNLCEPITPGEVARACYCSESSLQNLFRQVSGYRVKDYIIKRRLTRAARDLLEHPQDTVLDIALRYCYSSNEAFTRAFEQVWNCKPSLFRSQRSFADLHPRLSAPGEYGDPYMKDRRPVDISQLYDLLKERRGCCFICCDVKSLTSINEISHKAGDLAIAETARRMECAAGDQDLIFRIGGDEFVLLTASQDSAYAESLAEKIRCQNGAPFLFEGREVPLTLYVSVTRFEGTPLRYNELFESLHRSIRDNR